MKMDMRRKDRQVQDPKKIEELLNRADVLHLALADEEIPYVVALSYGYALENGKLTFYFHSAKSGHKIDLIHTNPNAAIQIDCPGRFLPAQNGKACTASVAFDSLFGQGRIREITDPKQKENALCALIAHCLHERNEDKSAFSWDFDTTVLDHTAVFAVDVQQYTVKHHG